MKKALIILVSCVVFAFASASSVYASGGQNHGDVGQGETEQGDAGSGSSPGDNAQGNQAD
jgi:hypothetical protein